MSTGDGHSQLWQGDLLYGVFVITSAVQWQECAECSVGSVSSATVSSRFGGEAA